MRLSRCGCRKRASSWLPIVALLAGIGPGYADPITASEIRVIDGDTIEAHSFKYRMVGYDTPETVATWRQVGPDEQALGTIAKERLQELINSGKLELNETPCACPLWKVEGGFCNHGRKCAILTLNGKNIGDILIAEELAVPFVCSATRCPKMPDWPKIIESQHNH
jgi:endonuclease YncB( thermonuclease family)